MDKPQRLFFPDRGIGGYADLGGACDGHDMTACEAPAETQHRPHSGQGAGGGPALVGRRNE